MAKQYSKKFWIIFWSVSIVLLTAFWFGLQLKNNTVGTINAAIDWVPWLSNKKELKSVAHFANYLMQQDNQEKTFLVIFQNNMELRPGGGYIGSFGILKTKNGHVVDLQTHDLSNFDGRVPNGIPTPYPMAETLRVTDWKMRDSNWSPNWATNAEKAEYFYHLGQGQENFDGIIGINTGVLTSFLQATGPITLTDYPGTYDSENAILTLEYQVEKGYADQGIQKGERKTVMNELGEAIMQKVSAFSISQKIGLAKIILADLNEKNIQLYFKDNELESYAENVGWSGNVNQNWKQDYLAMIDANLGAYKSDYYMKRSFDYTIDLSGAIPKANLKLTYIHTGKVKDWMTRDYLSYLRVYVPTGSWLESSTGMGDVKFGEELGKKYFGAIVKVPLNETRTVEFKYDLPSDIAVNYDLLIQKESGLGAVPGKITVIEKDGQQKVYEINLNNEWQLVK